MSIFDEVKKDPEYNPKNSAIWFRYKINELTGNKTTYQHSAMMRIKGNKLENSIIPGHLYTYKYDPKGKDTLPYYDIYPLVLPFRRMGPHFWGLNFHYIHPLTRGILFEKLLHLKDERSRMLFTWKLVKGGIFPGAKYCVKQYIVTHVRTQFLRIPEADWKIALFLPTQKFIGASSADVWKKR